MENLIERYEELNKEITSLKKEKNDFELANMDLNSKDTLTKQYMNLQNSSIEYKIICDDLNTKTSLLDTVQMKINVLRNMSHMFKSQIEFSNYTKLYY